MWSVAHHYGWLKFLENRSIDWRFEFRGEIEAPLKVVYVNVDTLSLNTIGGWPWSRGYFATVADALIKEGHARAVGYDFVFSDAGIAEAVDIRKLVAGNTEFGRFLITQPPVVLAAAYAGQKFLDVNGKERERILPIVATDTREVEQMEPPEIPSFETSPDPNKRRPYTPPVAIGLIDTLGNETRMVPAWAPSNIRRTFFHMSLELARLYWGLPVGAISIEGDSALFKRADGSVQAVVPLLHGQLLEVNWFTPWYSQHNAHAEFSDVFTYADALRSSDRAEQQIAREFFAQDGFKDAVVLIGPVDPLLQDIAPTSLDPQAVPKVSVHGNLLKTIVAGKFLSRLPDTSNHLIIFGLTLVVATLSLAGGARALFAKIMALLALGIYVALSFRIFEVSHFILPFTAPLGAALTTSFGGLIWQVVEEQKAKGRITGMFGAYVSPQLVERMVESGDDPQLGGHDAEITAYFSDIQSFSAFSEKLASGPLVELMNEYLTACTDIMQTEGGTLDKYIGD
ncbi:MAG: CHASE2 domain-containing protein, partial [Opitutus sp.]